MKLRTTKYKTAQDIINERMKSGKTNSELYSDGSITEDNRKINGIFTKNDIRYLLDQGYNQEQAIAMLSESDKYKETIEKQKRLEEKKKRKKGGHTTTATNNTTDTINKEASKNNNATNVPDLSSMTQQLQSSMSTMMSGLDSAVTNQQQNTQQSTTNTSNTTTNTSSNNSEVSNLKETNKILLKIVNLMTTLVSNTETLPSIKNNTQDQPSNNVTIINSDGSTEEVKSNQSDQLRELMPLISSLNGGINKSSNASQGLELLNANIAEIVSR